MEEHIYQDGDLLLKQGETGGFVLQVTSGEVEVFMQQGERSVVLGTVEAGGFLGEMGVIEGHTVHGASARARGEVATRRMDREEFLRLVSADDDLAYGLIERLISRVRASNERLAGSLAEPPAGAVAPRLTIHADGLMARPHIPPGGLVIDSLPFVVGRHSRHYSSGATLPDLLLEDNRPFRISRRHFTISREGDDFIVQDLESTLGTEVNGDAIGVHFGSDQAVLAAGENTVVAGGHGSPFLLRIHLA